MALNAYLTSTRQLLQNPSAPSTLYSDSDLTSWINTARGQLAGESESIRFSAALALGVGTQVYNFSSIDLTGSTGVQGVINVRTIWLQVASGRVWIRPRPFEWLSLYALNNPVPQQGPPVMWSQYAQGVGGSIYFSPVPDFIYAAILDTVCYPVPLVDDTTPEAIPYLWTDAVPYFAAYLALLSSQNAARQNDAQRMFERYTDFANRARRFSTPSVLPYQYPQSGNPVRANQLGASSGGGAG